MEGLKQNVGFVVIWAPPLPFSRVTIIGGSDRFRLVADPDATSIHRRLRVRRIYGMRGQANATLIITP